ncbi:MAG: LamG domain-containing protein [Caldilineaceae bacterium]
MCFGQNDLIGTVQYFDTKWHHWVCTYDTASKRRIIYRDGVQVSQDTASANYTGSGVAYIGQGFDGAWRFKGALDEVGIWNTALSAEQVHTLYEKVKVADESILTCQLPAMLPACPVDHARSGAAPNHDQTGRNQPEHRPHHYGGWRQASHRGRGYNLL